MPHKKLVEEGGEACIDFAKLKNYFAKGGQAVIPVVVQDVNSQQVLMLAYANEEALEATLRSGWATFYSTSRDDQWTKGELSGSKLSVCQIKINCEQNSLLYLVEPLNNTGCHTYEYTKTNRGWDYRKSCFYRTVEFAGDKSGLELGPDRSEARGGQFLVLPNDELLLTTLKLLKKTGIDVTFTYHGYDQFNIRGKVIFDHVAMCEFKRIGSVIKWSDGWCMLADLDGLAESRWRDKIVEVAKLDYSKLGKPAIVGLIVEDRPLRASYWRNIERFGKMLKQALAEEDNS